MKHSSSCLACGLNQPASPSLLCEACKKFVRLKSRLIDLRIEREDKERYFRVYGVPKPSYVNPFKK